MQGRPPRGVPRPLELDKPPPPPLQPSAQDPWCHIPRCAYFQPAHPILQLSTEATSVQHGHISRGQSKPANTEAFFRVDVTAASFVPTECPVRGGGGDGVYLESH